MLAFFLIWGVSLTHPMLAFCRGSFSYTSHDGFLFFFLNFFFTGCGGETQAYTYRAGFIFIWGVSLTHPMLISFFIAGSFSYTSRTGFVHIPFFLFYSGEFLLHIPCWHFSVGSFSHTSRMLTSFHLLFFRVGGGYGGGGGGYLDIHIPFFFFLFLILGVSLTHPVLAFTCGEFLLHIPCWLYIFYLGSFSYTSHVSFIFPSLHIP